MEARLPDRARTLPLALLAAGALAVALPPLASGASRTATLSGWGQVTADLDGRHLAFTDALTVVIDPADADDDLPSGLRPFRYYRLDAGSARLDGSRTRFVGDVAPQVTMRTSIGRLPKGDIDLAPGGRFATTGGALAFAAPVVWCCNDEDVEVVLDSSGRADAPRPLATGTTGTRRARWIARHADGLTRLHVADPLDDAPPAVVPFPGDPHPARVALAGNLAAWVERGGPTDAVRIARVGAGAEPRQVPVGGTVLEVHVDDGEVLALTRSGATHRVVRIDRAGRISRPWTGRVRPRVAVGGGAVAVAVGKRVLAGRRAPLREVRRAAGRVSALAIDGSRVAVFERRTVKRSRATVVRIWKVS